VLGYIDPAYFLGGRFPLSRERAERAIRRRVAEPLAISVEEAAQRIRRMVDGLMGQEIYKQTALKGHDPRMFSMFAFGGAGPVHACDIAEFADFGEIFTFPFGSEFNAYGAAAMDIVQSYERTHQVLLYDPVRDRWFDDVDVFNGIVSDLVSYARRDLAEEGFGDDDVCLELELDMNYSGQHHTVRHKAAKMQLSNVEDVRSLAADFNESFGRVYGEGATYPEGGIEIQLFKLTGTATLEKPVATPHPQSAADAAPTTRRCWWAGSGWEETPVFQRRLLGPGVLLTGPALLEDVDTVVALAPGWTYEVGGLLEGRLTRRGL
jgi:N-methylhydantoinase A/oxoprolinase/acetone carboxylase beta subunit